MKRNRLFLIILALLSAFVPRIWAQEQPTVSTDLEVLIPYETMQGQGATGIELMPASFYKFNYETVDASGNPIVLSSALIAPRDVTQTIGAVYMDCHYTITNNLEAPTSWTLPMFDLATGFSTALARYLAVPYYEDQGNSNAPYGLIIAPDYEGFGVSIERPQPYLAQELTARQVVDAMAKGMELYRKLIVAGTAPRLDNDWHSYAFGLSQGGAVALAVQRYIEQNDLSDQFNYNGTLCVEGPYDLITTLKYYLEDNGSSYDVSTAHRAGQTTMPVVIPMIIQGMLVSDPSLSSCQLSDFLSQKFLDTGIMDWLAAKNMTTDDIKAAWNNQRQNGFTANGRTYTPEDMATLFTSNMYANLNEVFTSDFFAYLSTAGIFDNVPDVPEANDPQRAYKLMHRAMAAQDLCTGWTPQHKIQFWHSKKDMVVPFGNYLAFQEAQPSGENSIYRLKDISDEGDHLDACSSFFYDAFNEYNTTFEWILWEGQYWEGDGNSWETAYLIRNCRELDTLAARVNRGNGYSGKYFKLMNDLVYDYTGLGETETNYTPIGFYDDDIHNYFRGHFDGGNHTISGLRIYGVTIGQGLFGVVMEAEVKNVILDDAIIAGSHCAGGIIGLSYYGTADNCHVTSSVTIRNIPDRSQYHHGGIVGQNQRGTIKYCISEATIIGYPNGKYFGGILGGNYTEGGNLYNNFAIGVTVPASKDNTTHGAILGQKNISELTNNYYFNCTVADEENTVTKGCENANVAENDGAVPVFSLTIPEGFGAEGIATITYNSVDYYKSGTTITLIAPDDRTYTYYVNDEPIEGNSFTMTANTVVTAFFDWAVNYEGTADDPYLIWSTEDWDLLCTRVNDLSVPNTYEGSYFKLMDDISVNTMVGHTLMGAFETKFKGTFDGGGKTLTFTYTSNNTNEQFIAPFRIIEGATIKNLKVAGTIDTKSRFAGGVVANARGAGNVITNCMSSITINATNTNDYSGYHGGILGQLSGSGGNVTLSGCVFNGKMLGTHVQGWSGILGNIINGGTFTISNCLFYPEEINIRNTEYNSNYTICFGGDDAPNCYYNEVGAEMSYVQGKEAKSIIAGENIDAVAFAGDATEYTASGLTAYANNHGMLYCDGTNCTLIAGYNDNVSLNLTVPSGFVITDATYAYEGGSETITPVDGVYSFTMPYADVTINAEMVCGIVIHAYTENSEDHYYLIASPI